MHAPPNSNSETDNRIHQIRLERDTVQRLAIRFIDREENAASDRAARKFSSYRALLLALLKGHSPQIELHGTEDYYRDLCRLAGDIDAAFEIGQQLGVNL